MKSIFLNNKLIEKERENSKINNNNINNNRYNLKDNKKNFNLNKININESLEQMNKINNNLKTSIIQLNKENSTNNFNDSLNINKSKRIISSKLLSQENRLKRNYNNTNSNSNIIESKYISKKDNNKNQNKTNKEQNNKNNNIIKVDFVKINNNNLMSAKSSLNILSKNDNKNIQIKNLNEKNKNNINMKSSNSNMKIEIIKRNYSLDKNKDEKNNNKKKNNNNNNIINSNKNIKLKYNNEKNDNKISDKVIQRNKGSPNHKRVDIVETRLKKNLNSKNNINNIQNINIKYSQDLDNIINNSIKNNLNNSKSNKEIKEVKPLYKSINLINNSNNIYINDNSKEKEETNKENKEKEKDLIKIDTSKNISSEGYQFNSDNYNIVQLLGEGTFGKIYLVEDPDDFKKYALKKISVSDIEELNDNKKEFELLMKLSQENPSLNVVKIYGIQVKKLDKFNLVMYVLMEAAQCDWENEIRNRNQYQAYYTEDELMKILLNLSTTLASLQKMGICHRDVKPQNILCFGKDNYKLSDFGEAKKKKKRKINGNYIYDFEGDTSKQTVRGTELYMSPILFKALHDCPEVDLEYNAYKSDVFSLGLCMLLSSTLGFQALYDIRELYDNNKIKKIIEKYLSGRYSKDYIKLISSMLQIKEKNRPDFIELQDNIQKIYYHKDKIE